MRIDHTFQTERETRKGPGETRGAGRDHKGRTGRFRDGLGSLHVARVTGFVKISPADAEYLSGSASGDLVRCNLDVAADEAGRERGTGKVFREFLCAAQNFEGNPGKLTVRIGMC
ncbi:MAG: hypothetical protein BWY42_01625 [Candidatus Omnitrophica bacterium ADurb.Bin277]|nr:MAG: hypothetical protein BWY42_01625 [Candidatus Omnitrophica bacterium ADurb.Bin277]